MERPESFELSKLEIQQLTGWPDTLVEDYRQIGDAINELFDFIQTVESERMRWLNVWADGQYQKNDMVRDGLWLMVANKVTSDRAAPQPVGSPENSIDPAAIFTTQSDTSVIKMVHSFAILKAGWLQSLRVRVPFWDADSFSRITIVNVSTGESSLITDPILASNAWVTLAADNLLVVEGNQITVSFEFYNSSNVGQVAGGWVASSGTGIPANQRFNMDSFSLPTSIRIDHTDLDSVGRATELDGVIVDSIIRINETGNVTRNIELKVISVNTASATSTEYGVTVINNGDSDIRNNQTCSIVIDIPLSVPSEYSQIANYYPTNNPSWAAITTQLYYDGVQQPSTTDAYGIDIIFQDASISDDWDAASLAP